ncbi:MAG: DUF2933 domain-containing protein [Micromonosporaceae bacterium]
MHGTNMRYLFIAAGALVVGLLAAGTPVQSVLPFVLLLACPLMMVVMMRSMGGHAGHDGDQGDHQGHDGPARDRDDATTGR